MKNGRCPSPNTVHPIPGYDKEIYVKPTITNPNIIVGDFTYMLDFKWWDKSVEEINQLIPLLTCGNLEKVKAEISERLHEKSLT